MRTLTMPVAALSLAPLVIAGCYAGSASPYDGGANADTSGSSSAGSGGGSNGSTTSVDGTPCEVAALLEQYCVRCHNGGRLSASDLPLTSYADLTASSAGDTVAAKALAKLNDTRKPMPPRGEPAPSARQVQAFSDWVAAGAPPGSCAPSAMDTTSATPGAGDASGSTPLQSAYDTPTTCTSGSHWTSGNEESPKMHPGRACIACHASGEGPSFQFAGTLYASAHEPNDCNGAALDTSVIITDANGQELVLRPNAVGNFSARRTNLVMPYTARLERGGSVREMVGEQENGDCNGCHTESGKNKAPGRIMAPDNR